MTAPLKHPATGSWELQFTAELGDGGGQVSVVVACDRHNQRGAGLAPPNVLDAVGVGGPAG
ncbi:hypothetical protein OHA63_00290 [Streptomyces anulatus]|uniref:hypothetical protein n=1 Tax=Streptomyces anulatus TaxID=1892 RepID=UPI002E37B7E6|nr:hypothetical protein [Streptomyces anulatus]